MGIEIVHDQHNLLRCRVAVDQVSHGLCEINRRSPIRDLDMSLPCEWLEPHKQICGSIAFVFVINAFGLSRSNGNRFSRLLCQLLRLFVETDDGTL